MGKRSHNPAHFAILACLFCAALLLADVAQAQIARVPNDDGRMLFVNAEPPPTLKLSSRRGIGLRAIAKPIDLMATAKRIDLGAAAERSSIYLPPETSLSGKLRPSLN